MKRASAFTEAAARAAYSLIFRLATPAALLRYWWRGRVEPTYRFAPRERLGLYESQAQSGLVWVHAVSLGETRAAAALIHALRAQLPNMRLLLTHGTATGRDAGRALLRDGDVQAWLPLDTPGATSRFFTHFKPAAGVLMETEVWPNLIHAASIADAPLVLANARLSERSQRKGERLSALLRPALGGLNLVLAQSEDDARRFSESGASAVRVAGNLKYDMTPDAAQCAAGRTWRETSARRIVLAASTREGEEGPLLEAWCSVPLPRPLLLVVPRHPQRFDEVAQQVGRSGLSLVRRSSWAQSPPQAAREADVWLGDSLGEMPVYFSAAHAALLGGSFAPLGGQNLIEAAACGCPIVMGPHTFNFAEAAELALEANAAVRTATMAQGVAQACEMATSREQAQWAARAEAFAATHRGAAQGMALALAHLLAERAPPGPGPHP